jgi:hypothetical protein
MVSLRALSLLTLLASSSGCVTTTTVTVHGLADVSAEVRTTRVASGTVTVPTGTPFARAEIPGTPVVLVRTPRAIELQCASCGPSHGVRALVLEPDLVLPGQDDVAGRMQRTGLLVGRLPATALDRDPLGYGVVLATPQRNVREIREHRDPVLFAALMLACGTAALAGGSAAVALEAHDNANQAPGAVLLGVGGALVLTGLGSFGWWYRDRVTYRAPSGAAVVGVAQ